VACSAFRQEGEEVVALSSGSAQVLGVSFRSRYVYLPRIPALEGAEEAVEEGAAL